MPAKKNVPISLKASGPVTVVFEDEAYFLTTVSTMLDHVQAYQGKIASGKRLSAAARLAGQAAEKSLVSLLGHATDAHLSTLGLTRTETGEIASIEVEDAEQLTLDTGKADDAKAEPKAEPDAKKVDTKTK